MKLHESAKTHILKKFISIASRTIPADQSQVGALFSSNRPEEQSYRIDRPTLEDFVRLRDELLGKYRWGNQISKTALHQAMQRMIARIMAAGEITESNVATEFDGFYESLFGECVPHTAYVPLVGVVLEMEPISLGQVTLVRMQASEIAKILETPTMKRRCEEDPDAYSALSKYIVPLQDVTAIKYEVNAESGLVLEQAVEQARNVVDVLRYFAFVSNLVGNSVIGLQGEAVTNLGTSIALTNEGNALHIRNYIIRSPEYLTLSEEFLPTMQEYKLFELFEILGRENPTEFEYMILDGIHWFASAQHETEEAYQLLSLSVCLETFFSRQEDERIAETLAEGIAIILARSSTDRAEIRSAIRVLYGKRSAVSHGRSLEEERRARTSSNKSVTTKIITSQDVEALRRYAGRTIMRLIELPSQFSTKDAFLDALKKAKDAAMLTTQFPLET
jgi:hypothetical protein